MLSGCMACTAVNTNGLPVEKNSQSSIYWLATPTMKHAHGYISSVEDDCMWARPHLLMVFPKWWALSHDFELSWSVTAICRTEFLPWTRQHAGWTCLQIQLLHYPVSVLCHWNQQDMRRNISQSFSRHVLMEQRWSLLLYSRGKAQDSLKISNEPLALLYVRFSPNGWMNNTLTIDYLHSVTGTFSFSKHLLVWGAYRCHTSAAAWVETACLRLHTSISSRMHKASCGMSTLKATCEASTMPAGHQYTERGNLKPPSCALLCEWVKSCWEAVPNQMVKDSFISCAITTTTDGSNGIHYFKAGQPCVAGKSKVEEETKKLQASGRTESLS